MLTYDDAHRIFSYNSRSGILAWKSSVAAWRNGGEAGWLRSDGYREVNVDGERHRVHRIIWLMQTGNWPENLIDHRNGKRADNRWANLRAATRSQNNHNRHAVRKDSISGIRGVKYRRDRDRYVPVLKVNGRMRKFGSFRTPEEAAARFKEVETKYRGEHAACLF